MQEVTRAGTGAPGDDVVEAQQAEVNLVGQRNAFVAAGVLAAPTRQRASSPGLRRRWLVATALLTVGADVVAIGLG